MTREEFQNDIRAGIPDRLSAAKPYDKQINHAPKRKDILSDEEKTLALKNALISRYNLAGSAYWRKGLEEPEVWAAMEKWR